MKDKNQFLTPEEARKYLRVNKRTIYRWANSGKIPAVRAGKQWRFRKTKLDQWLLEQAKNRSPKSHK